MLLSHFHKRLFPGYWWMRSNMYVVVAILLVLFTNGNVDDTLHKYNMVYGWSTTTVSMTCTNRNVMKRPFIRMEQKLLHRTIFTTTPRMKTILRNAKSSSSSDTGASTSTRRDYVMHQLSTILSVSSAVLLYPEISNAATSSSPSTNAFTELQQRLPLGHARVKYLLDHWDEITSVCGTSVMSDIERKQVIRTEGGGGSNGKDACSKTPLRVQEFMGYKSTNDPLYKIDKLLIRVGSSSTNFMNNDDYSDFIDTVEQYRTTADATALLAYTSSWGEANPYVNIVDTVPAMLFVALL
jgi:hypothetical protein